MKKINREHILQSQVIAWCFANRFNLPGIELIFAIPNSQKLIARLPNKQHKFAYLNFMKAEGMKTGVPDLFLPVPRKHLHGMFIEMKAGKNKPSDDQTTWLADLALNNYKVVVCNSFESAQREIIEYMNPF